MKTVVLFFAMAIAGGVFAQTPFLKKYILAYHSCANGSCGSPSNHTVRLAEGDDGVNWTDVPGFTPYAGSVPDPVVRGSKVYIYTPASGTSTERVMRYDKMTDTWDATTSSVTVSDSAGNHIFFVDPSAFVDNNGLINLFFLNTNGITGDPAQCSAPPCTRYFDSAIEVPGSDGTQFTLQSSHRISYTVTGSFGPTDPDIFYDGSIYRLYISQGTTTSVYESASLHGAYTAITTLPSGNQLSTAAGIPCGIFNADSSLYMSYGHSNNGSSTEIRMAFHSGFTAAPAYNTILTGASTGLGSSVSVASPGICENTLLTFGTMEYNSEKFYLNLYPNPAGELLNISMNNVENTQVNLYDVSGKLLGQFFVNTSNYSLNIHHLEKGIYFLRTNKSSRQFRFVKL